MLSQFLPMRLTRLLTRAFVLSYITLKLTHAQANGAPTAATGCHIEAVNYKGWSAQQMSNRWVQLIIVPQNGGRLMQVTFAGHAYLFVNPKYAGKYMPPAPDKWFNYGGDKLWPLPEGNNDEQHWAGASDVLDDGPYAFRKISEEPECEVELTGPADAQTGIQFSRTIRIDSDSARIQFRATMKNVTGHSIEWSMQSVTQYDASDSGAQQTINHKFWTFTPANLSSSYLNRYHVRFGPAENSAVSVRDDGLFALHYAHMAAELWLDSAAGWLAVVDGSTDFAMVERFRYEEHNPSPGKASVIFWTNGPELHLNSEGEAVLSGGEEGQPPYYLEAEINSPMCRLRPGETCEMQTEWFPTRAGDEFHGATEAGILIHPLRANLTQDHRLKLSGSFGVFYAGRLIAHLYDEHGTLLGTIPIINVNPTETVSLGTEVSPNAKPARLSLHLETSNGVDRGSLQEVPVSTAENR
jgi:hypothetical protein